MNSGKISGSVGNKRREYRRKPYTTPRVEALGDIRTLTLGSTSGGLDDGGGMFPRRASSSPFPP